MAELNVENLEVLMLEDSPTQALMLKEALEKHRLQVRVAKDGVEGLQLLQEQAPKVIICDIEMPRMNGYDFCRHVKTDARFKEIPVILLTNLTDSMDVIKGIECGADSFLTKPCEINFLLSTIVNVIENKKLPKKDAVKKQHEFFFNGQRHLLQVNDAQITELLFSTYTSAIQKNTELENAYRKLNLATEELEKKNEELKLLNEQKNQWFGMAAHDLRNPLTVVQGYSELLSDALQGKTDDDTKKMLDRIKTSSTLMLQLINDMLDISAIESGTVSLNLSKVDLKELAQESIALHKSIADKKNVTIKLECKGEFPKVTCDSSKMFQVLNNLISNAVKFSNSGSTVEVSLIQKENQAQISVKDYGIGMSTETKERLFQPFAKARMLGTAGEKGTGLGLAIVNRIVNEHKGTISIESEPGKGSQFVVSLPVV